MQKATSNPASPETRLIPLHRLRHDERNARNGADDPATAQADAELAASIRAHGLLENLVVTPRTKTLFGVAAGARRLRALHALAAEQYIPRNHPVPCLVVDNDAAAESSLAENTVRIAMHPADQVTAFTRLVRDGATTEQIAARFGVSERTVQKRARLGGLPAEILDAYRAGIINTDAAEAFATTADADFQRAVFKSLSDVGQLHAHAVRQALDRRQTRSDAPSALLVGLDAYRAAGGKVEDPLFEEGYVSILDPDIMHDLALRKLQAEAAKHADDWKWTAAQIEFTWLDQQRYVLAPATTTAPFTDAEARALDEAASVLEEAGEAFNEPDLDAERRRELRDAIARAEQRNADIRRARDARDEYGDAARAHGGLIVALDSEGHLELHPGLVRPDDVEAYRAAIRPDATDAAGDDDPAPQPDDAGAAPAKKNGGWTDTLRNDLRVMRTAAVRRALTRNPAVATDLIGFVLARLVGLGRERVGHEPAVLALRREYQGVYASDAMKASPAMRHLDPVPDVELAGLGDDDPAAAFRAYRALPEPQRASVLAHAVAALTVPHLADDGDVSGAHEEAVRCLDVDFPAELAAIGALPFDADLVWNRMNKGLILAAGAAALGDEWADRHGALKKKDLVTAAAEAFRHDPARDAARDDAAARWLPPGFETIATEPQAANVPAPAAVPTADATQSVATATTDAAATATSTPDDESGDAPAATDGDVSEPSAEATTGDGALPAFLVS